MTPYESLLATISKDSVKKYVYCKPKKKPIETIAGSQSLSQDTYVPSGDSPDGDVLDKDDADYRDNELESEEEQEEGEGEAAANQQCGKCAYWHISPSVSSLEV